MALKLMYITNQEEMAIIAETSGVDWIFIDLEINGKDARQGHLDTVISRHSIKDVRKIKRVLTKSELLVRVNPIHLDSQDEIEKVIEDGADIVMLPYFKSKEEVETFVKHVNGKAKVCLLWETSEAVENIDAILTVKGIDYIHIGLNDLHLSYNMKFMFELVANGRVERLCKKFNDNNIRYGFGGIAQLEKGMLPAENIITEHYRLNSSMAILSREFCNSSEILDTQILKNEFRCGVEKIRNFENQLLWKEESYFIENQEIIKNKVSDIVYAKTK